MIRYLFKLIILLFIIAAAGGYLIKNATKLDPNEATKLTETNSTSTTMNLSITSSAFTDNGILPALYTCDGNNVSPPLEIAGVPEGTKSLALIVHDPDAPVSGGWDHWVKFNIPPETKTIGEGKEPLGLAGKGSSGNLTYAGPCPPSGTHHYIFTLYALDTELTLAPNPSKKDVETAMVGHIVSTAQLVGLYSKK